MSSSEGGVERRERRSKDNPLTLIKLSSNMLKNQLLHNLIQKIEGICVRFDDHKQEVFNLAQALRALFLYTHSEKERVEEYGCNLKSFWDTIEAFGGTPGLH